MEKLLTQDEKDNDIVRYSKENSNNRNNQDVKDVQAKASFDMLQILVGLRNAIDIGFASPYVIRTANSNTSSNYGQTLSSEYILIVYMVSEWSFFLFSVVILFIRHYRWNKCSQQCSQTSTVYSASARYVLGLRVLTTVCSFISASLLTYSIRFHDYSTLATIAATLIALTSFLTGSLNEKFIKN